MPVSTFKMKKGPARVSRADPHHLQEQFAAEQTARKDNSPSAPADQLSARVLAAVDLVSAAVEGPLDALTPRERMESSARLMIAAVALRAPSYIALKEAAGRAHRSPDLITPKQAAARAGVSTGTVCRWADRHDLGLKLGGRRLIVGARLAAFLGGAR